MALIVEDGSGLSTATSYVSLADAGTWHAARGNTAWASASEAAREVALVRATAALDMHEFVGLRESNTQALAWPRYNAVDRDGFEITGIPTGLKSAVCAAALVELSSSGALTPAMDRSSWTQREKVGPVEIEYKAGAPARTNYTEISGYLAGLVRTGVKVVRT